MAGGDALALRGYQQQAIAAVHDAIARGVTRPAVVLATGLGKTVIFAHLVAGYLAANPGRVVLVLVHRDELAQQARAKIHSVAPHLRVGMVKGRQRDVNRVDVIVASVQTVGQANGKVADTIRGVGLIIADECHHAAAATWRRTLERFGAWHGVPAIGFTATMSREDKLGLGEIWQEVVFKRDTVWGIRHGYLCDVRGVQVRVPQLDYGRLNVDGGAAAQAQVGELLMHADTGPAVAKAVQEYASDRPGVVFAPDVASAHDFCEHLRGVGFGSEVITGATPTGGRARIYDAYRRGVVQILVNAMVLTEGWDAPWASCAVIARPTKSRGLYQQMVGRVLRPFPAGGKRDALVLDVVGASVGHNLASIIDLSPDRPPVEGRSVLEMFEDDPELFEREEEESWVDPNAYGKAAVDRVVGEEVDLLAEAEHTPWLQTNRGTWFILANELVFFLYPEPGGTVTIGVDPLTSAMPAWAVATGMEFGLAMERAELMAVQHAPEITGKAAPWRAQGDVNQSLWAKGRKVGALMRPEMSKTEALNAITVATVSRRLDR